MANKKITRYNLLKYFAENKEKEIPEIEIKKIFNKDYIEFQESIRNLKMKEEISFSLASKWLYDSKEDEEGYFSITDLGISNYVTMKEQKKLQKHINIRSWVAIVISLIALLKSFI